MSLSGLWHKSVALSLALIVIQAVDARVITVGPDGEFKRIADAARHARNGDVVEIAPGRYRADVAMWPQDDLVIRGMGDGVVLDADGASMDGKAIWVIRGNRVEVSKLTFTGARVPDGNGAGIRLERGSLIVRDCQFLGNEMGILTANERSIELRVVDSLFANAVQAGHALPHLLYAGAIGALTVEGSRFQRGRQAHLIKSRARRSWVAYNTIDDGPDGAAAYELDFPDGGQVTVLGNIIGQSPSTSNSAMLAYGAEGSRWTINTLDVYHNTFVSRGWFPAWFVRVWQRQPGLKTRVVNNLFVGLGGLLAGPVAATRGNHLALPTFQEGEPADRIRLRSGDFKSVRLHNGELDLLPTAEPGSPIGRRSVPADHPLLPGAMQMPMVGGGGLRAWQLPWTGD